jgi:hypothetical protein
LLLAGLPAATLSLLPGGHLTQLVLAAPDLEDPSLQELAAITSLQDLRLPVLNPARPRLAPVFAPMTRLTRLLLCNPAQALLDSLPASLLTLELARWHQTTLRIAQLTALHTLQLTNWESLGSTNKVWCQLEPSQAAAEGCEPH